MNDKQIKIYLKKVRKLTSKQNYKTTMNEIKALTRILELNYDSRVFFGTWCEWESETAQGRVIYVKDYDDLPQDHKKFLELLSNSIEEYFNCDIVSTSEFERCIGDKSDEDLAYGFFKYEGFKRSNILLEEISREEIDSYLKTCDMSTLEDKIKNVREYIEYDRHQDHEVWPLIVELLNRDVEDL